MAMRRESNRERKEQFQSFSRPKVKIARTSASGKVYIDYKDTESLRKMISGNGKILSRKRTGASAMEQRMIARAVKRARYMARFGVDAADKSRGQGETIIRGAPVTDGTRSTSFLITASDVTIDGFTVQDDSSSNLYGAGIVIAPGVHGTHIVNNIVQSNIAGLYLANN